MRSTQRQRRIAPNLPQQLKLQQLTAPESGGFSSHTAMAPRRQGGNFGSAAAGAGRSSDSEGCARQDSEDTVTTSSAALPAAILTATPAQQAPRSASHGAAEADPPQADSWEGRGVETQRNAHQRPVAAAKHCAATIRAWPAQRAVVPPMPRRKQQGGLLQRAHRSRRQRSTMELSSCHMRL